MKNYDPKYNWHQGQLCQENKYRNPAIFELHWTLFDQAIQDHIDGVEPIHTPDEKKTSKISL